MFVFSYHQINTLEDEYVLLTSRQCSDIISNRIPNARVTDDGLELQKTVANSVRSIIINGFKQHKFIVQLSIIEALTAPQFIKRHADDSNIYLPNTGLTSEFVSFHQIIISITTRR